MIAALLITLREGLEAALVVGIVLGVLNKLGRAKRRRSVWLGVGAAIAASALVALAFNALGVTFEGQGEQIFEGVAMLVAAGVLTWMIFWMRRQRRDIRAELETDVRRAAARSNAWGLFSLSFVAVLREGIETVLFLTAAAFGASALETLVGGALGLLLAVVLGWLMFVAGRRLNVRTFFSVTSVLLILFAGGLVAHGVHELQEASVLPTIVEHVWDLNTVLDEAGVAGQLLQALFGYNGNPSLLEALAYVAYLAIVGALRGGRRPLGITRDGQRVGHIAA